MAAAVAYLVRSLSYSCELILIRVFAIGRQADSAHSKDWRNNSMFVYAKYTYAELKFAHAYEGQRARTISSTQSRIGEYLLRKVDIG